MTPAERVKKVRSYNNLTQKELGEKIGLDSYQIRDIELGKVKVTPLLARIFYHEVGINPDWLLHGNDPMTVGHAAYSPEEQKYIDMLVEILRGENSENVTAIQSNIRAFWKSRNMGTEEEEAAQAERSAPKKRRAAG